MFLFIVSSFSKKFLFFCSVRDFINAFGRNSEHKKVSIRDHGIFGLFRRCSGSTSSWRTRTPQTDFSRSRDCVKGQAILDNKSNFACDSCGSRNHGYRITAQNRPALASLVGNSVFVILTMRQNWMPTFSIGISFMKLPMLGVTCSMEKRHRSF